MIVAPVSVPLVRRALVRAARPDEDVVSSPHLVGEALARGFPRLLVRLEGEGFDGHRPSGNLPVLVVTPAMLELWERERVGAPVPAARVDALSMRLRVLVADESVAPRWVDRSLADVSRALGAPLPAPFRGLARRVLEFPSHYADLGALEEVSGLSRGALKARFRRRELPSPTTWIRLLRVLAAAHVLSDRSVTTLQAAYRIGFSDSGNFCRLIRDVAGGGATELREATGYTRLVLELAGELGGPGRQDAWTSLGDVFVGAA